jgi:hypothetical protein
MNNEQVEEMCEKLELVSEAILELGQAIDTLTHKLLVDYVTLSTVLIKLDLINEDALIEFKRRVHNTLSKKNEQNIQETSG